jgi:alpha-L-rhamnosidase
MSSSAGSNGGVHTLRIEHVAGGTVDAPEPRFAWLLPDGHPGQGAYRLQVEKDEVPLWDSGWVADDATAQREYAGPPLVPFGRYRWRVAATADESDAEPRWSAWAEWDSGPMSPADWLPARWIGAVPARCEPAPAPDERAIPDPLLRRRIEIRSGLRRGTLYWSGLGGAIAHVDGRRLSATGLEPAPTRYDRTALYQSADLGTALVEPGGHFLGFELGRGKFGEPRESVWQWHVAPWWDHPKLIVLLRLEYADGVETIVSDDSWEWVDGPIRADSLLGGERFDARLRRPGWLAGAGVGVPVRTVRIPGGRPCAQVMPPIRVVDELPVVAETSPEPNVRVFDFGRQLAGWARTRLRGPSGATVRIGYAEKLLPDGRIDDRQQHVVPPLQQDVVTLDGTPLEHEPSFGYRGFRYVQVEARDGAALDAITARLAHTDVSSRAEFSCGSPVLEQIRDASRRSILDNLHGILTDTPIHEKNGWTGDALLSLEATMLEFDLGASYTKWLQDFADAQRDDGEIPSVIPAGDWGYSDSPSRIRGPIPAWDAAYPEICWAMYRYLGDRRVLATHLPRIVRYLDMLGSRWPDFLIDSGIGDWKPPDADGRCPEGHLVYGTMFAYRIAWLVTAMARVLGDAATAGRHAALMRRIRATFVQRFRVGPGDYRGDRPTGYRQSVNAVALRFGLLPGPERAVAVDNLLADIATRDGHLNTGAHGTKYLPLVLTRAGHAETAVEVLTTDGYPSYARWFATGETNLWEGWADSVRSRNHHYFSSPVQWMHEHLLGVTPSAPGYRAIRVEPWLLRSIGHASGALETAAGRIEVDWECDGDGWRVGVEVPSGVTAIVRPRLPGADRAAAHHVGSGQHEFTKEG